MVNVEANFERAANCWNFFFSNGSNALMLKVSRE